jgi:hypothetical protein
MTDISKHPLLRQCYEVMGAIEKCGFSAELSEAVTRAGALMRALEAELDKRSIDRRCLYSVDTKNFPGKVRLRFVEFSEEFVNPDNEEFKRRRLPLCDANDPVTRAFVATMTGGK